MLHEFKRRQHAGEPVAPRTVDNEPKHRPILDASTVEDCAHRNIRCEQLIDPDRHRLEPGLHRLGDRQAQARDRLVAANLEESGKSQLRYRVLAIDADPQGSLSMLFGLLPEVDIPDSATLLPVLRGDLSDALDVARPTYWPNIDLIAAAPSLFGAEYSLYAMALEPSRSHVLAMLDRSLDAARQRYDVVIIDTPPSLSCLTINALLAANGLIIPLPPTALDFNSLAQLWALLSEIGRASSLPHTSDAFFDFVHILPSRVDRTDAAVPVVLRWMNAVYGDLVMPIEIPKTVVTSRLSAEFSTVYDVCDRSSSTRAHQRAKRAYDQMVAVIDSSIAQIWRKQESGGLS